MEASMQGGLSETMTVGTQGIGTQGIGTQGMGADVTRFKQWALMVGCLYGSVTLFVAILATVSVLAGRPTISSGYSSGPSFMSDHLSGGFGR
jgi:hypothetical protein